MEVSFQLHVPTALLPEKNPGAHWTGGQVGSTAGLHGFWEDRIPCPAGIRNSDSQARS